MKQNNLFKALLPVIIAFFSANTIASTLKLMNARGDGLGTFIAVDYGAQIKWHMLDDGQSIQIDSGAAKIKRIMYYDTEKHLFFEIELGQPGVITTVDHHGNAGVFTIKAGGPYTYVSKAYKPNLGVPIQLQWKTITYK